MSKFCKSVIPVFLCFCVICSLCGVTYAEGIAEDEVPLATRDPWLDSFESWTPDPNPDAYISDDPVFTEPSPEPVVTVPVIENTPAPVVSDEPLVSPEPSDTVFVPGGWDMPGGDTPAIDPSEFSSDNTYIMLPDDFIITSTSGLDDTYAIDPQVLSPVTPSNTSGLKAVLLSILGNYDPIVAQYQYATSSGNYQYIREIQPDYVWLVSAGIFAILLYCTWRLLGGLICSR